MQEVFSRWPSLAPTAQQRDAGETEHELPTWMQIRLVRRCSGRAVDIGAAILPVLGSTALAGVAGFRASRGPDLPEAIAIALSLLATLAIVLWAARLRTGRLASEERATALFERTGISMWREDWTEAARAVMALRRAGILDLETYFATRPDQLRLIKSRVIIKDVNSFTVEETGAPSKAVFLGSLDRLLPDTDQTFVQWLVAFGRGDRFFRSEAHVTGADGAPRDMLFTAMLPNDLDGFADIIVTSVDITAFRQAQARLAATELELARQSRLTTAGALSASIAHEVNSPLTAILANAQAALRWLRRAEPNCEEAVLALEDTVSAATRARDVVARTRSLLGNAPRSLEPVDLVHAARDASLLVEKEIRALGATLHLAPGEHLPRVRADLIQVQQVFTNLFLNAAQAMVNVAGPRDIAVRFERVDQARLKAIVIDAGPGVPEDRRGTIFDPFHSTRPEGMGMGLAICRTCIDANGGDIWVETTAAGGAAFHFTLPVHDA